MIQDSRLKTQDSRNVKIVFFGTSPVAVGVLDALKADGYLPALIVTTPDAPAGRKLALKPPPAKLWALANDIPLLQPTKLNSELNYKLQTKNYQLFLVASYGKLIPKKLLGIPKHGTLNVHPSLLPKYRGPSPIQSAILNGDSETGVTIMLMDEKMDEGPILAEERVALNGTEVNEELELKLSTLGGHLLARVIPDWLASRVEPRPQDHAQATYTHKFNKANGLIDPHLLSLPSYGILQNSVGGIESESERELRETTPPKSDSTAAEAAERMVRAFNPSPGTYTIITTKRGKQMRVKILSASIRDDRLLPLRVIPEGKRETSWEEFVWRVR
ncbi:MAG: methionyl-tRNA formyltransferase [Candidatus Vogelbacteria bacterium CG10_big_fil_rev_8_21_14_0_10_51_16]|uniref:Methionyl-tRNA formyltransferase n=1 Tax=Candidatus Vogelbacteria bacterium CG10_big_fil_rev_8_21_14_0_10_51_16 TaxID=1975045 RepID=A0A2H0REA5_9BACT|nr:MAG: methionyl-tRNA formyltransferase [Candidatus Vogelbacteria bacterium CG10_big_fil_rev_8_21_14_0_10_51_16]